MGIDSSKIVLVGFMGTGKSTVARLLAERLGIERIDLDERIVREAGCPISELFEKKGEPYFRDLESRMLAELMASDEPFVLATGGGAVLREANREAMLHGGFVVALKADAEQIIARVSGDTSRPLLAGDAAANVRRLLEQRSGAYDFAHLTIDTSGLPPQEVAARILASRAERT